MATLVARACVRVWMTLISGEQTLSTLARLLGVGEGALGNMLLQRVVATRGEIFTIQVALDDVHLVRDAIVKSLYEVRERSDSFFWAEERRVCAEKLPYICRDGSSAL